MSFPVEPGTTRSVDVLRVNKMLSISGSLTSEGTMVAQKDNASSFRLRGPDFNGDMVQSYAGIFYNAAYLTKGTLETRVIFGANIEMDLELQSPHALMLTAVDDTQSDGKIVASSKTGMELHARADAEVVSPKHLIFDRETTGSTGAGNTSNATVETNSGDLVLWPGRAGAEDDAKVSIKHLVNLEVLAGDPASPADGDVWRTAAGIRAKIGSSVGTLDFTADP